MLIRKENVGLPWGHSGKNLPVNAEDKGLIFGAGRFHILWSN